MNNESNGNFNNGSTSFPNTTPNLENNNNINNGVFPYVNQNESPIVNNIASNNNEVISNNVQEPLIQQVDYNQPINNGEVINQQQPQFIDASNNAEVNSTNENINSRFFPNQSPMAVDTNNVLPNNIQEPSINPVAYNQPVNNDEIGNQQQPQITNVVNNEELLKVFVGENYEKITTKPFNFAGFFFTTLYMFYRKMFLYGMALFIVNLIVLNFINSFIVDLALNVIVGLYINKIYLYYANNKINKIKANNPQKSMEDIKGICAMKGGTSIGNIFLGFFVEFVITLVVVAIMFVVGVGKILKNLDVKIIDKDKNSGTLVEDVIVGGHYCLNSNCVVYIKDSNDEANYAFNADNFDFFSSLGDYSDSVKINIYYTESGQDKSINKYEIFLRTTNENITDIKTENELRAKIGLYTEGIHTDTFKLTKIGTMGVGFSNNASYTYVDYTFVDNNNKEYVMRYKIPNGGSVLNLLEGSKYSVTFEVIEGTFGLEFNLISVS